jgi:hypothetical protein
VKSNQESQGNDPDPFLYLLYTADTNVSIATFPDDMAVLAIHKDANIISEYLQNNLYLI